MNREDFIKFIPKPSNEDVILYDVSLKDLIDVDVPNEYHKLLPIFREEKKKVATFKKEIDTYKTTIEQSFVLDPSWSEEMYLQQLQEDTRTYSMLYGNIKKRENEIKICQKKIDSINDKIIIQKNKEKQEDEKRLLNINDNIEDNKLSIKKYQDNISVYRDSLKNVEKDIKDIKTNLRVLKTTQKQILKGNYECFCCGKHIDENESEIVMDRVISNIQEYTEKLETFLDKKNKIKSVIEFYKDELSRLKIEMQNNLAFKRNFQKIYVKKSPEILKLETLKFEYLNKLTELNKKLEKEPHINSKKFLDLKNNIEKYKLSLENLKKVKELKSLMQKRIKLYEQSQAKLEELQPLILKYLSFLNIYFKIYEQKASEYAGENYKIKLFEIKNCDIIEIINIIYKGVEYSQLTKRNKEIVDKNLAEKFLPDF